MREPDQRVGVRVRAEPEEGMNSPRSQQDRAGARVRAVQSAIRIYK
ncbi:hypothetical protein PA598K_02045 [Paenibacillus sp. 598K]|nr:hypothetical protein PA598K_02045 [Paenibacillus sp. 598K]